MASYSICLQPSVERDVRHISAANVERIFARIETLAVNPLPRGAVKLSGADGLYRVRAGDYRVVYELDKTGRRILIHYIRH